MAALGGILFMLGLIALGIAIVGLIKQRVRWTRVIATRRDAAFLLAGALVVMLAGGAVSPKPVPATPVAATAAAPSDSSNAAGLAPIAPAPVSTAPAAPTDPNAASSTVPVPAAVVAAPAPVTTIPTQRTYVAPPAPDYAPPQPQTAPQTASGTGTTGAYNGGGTPDTYTNVDGNQVERPDGSSAGASAKCRDGSYSHSQHRSGTCSGHDGVAQWLSP